MVSQLGRGRLVWSEDKRTLGELDLTLVADGVLRALEIECEFRQTNAEMSRIDHPLDGQEPDALLRRDRIRWVRNVVGLRWRRVTIRRAKPTL